MIRRLYPTFKHCGSILFVAVFLGSCATLSPDECRYLNWEVRGNFDGMAGNTLEKWETYENACWKHKIMLTQDNLEDYKAGRRQGLLDFCTMDNGYQIGLGMSFHRYVCVGIDGEASFLRAYDAGRSLGSARQQLMSFKRSISYNDQRARDLLKKNADYQAEISSGQLTDKEIDERVRQISQNSMESGRLLKENEQKIPQLAEITQACNEVVRRNNAKGFPPQRLCG